MVKARAYSKPHNPVLIEREKQGVYSGKGWKDKFICPECGRATYQSLNFLGARRMVCNGEKWQKMTASSFRWWQQEIGESVEAMVREGAGR